MTIEKPSTALARIEPAALAMIGTPSEAQERLRQLQEFVRSAMVEGIDYGKIPGTDKDTLYQPGAQKLSEIYSLAPSFEDMRPPIERWGDDGSDPLFAYFTRCVLTRKSDGMRVGEGIGSCNSREEKYSGRWVFERDVPSHLDLTRLRSREFKRKDGSGTFVKYRIPNEGIFDLVNTIQKMSAKRAMVMAVIGATRSAGIFTQDLEDMSPAARGSKGKPEASEAEFEESEPGERQARPSPPPVSPEVLRAREQWADPAAKWTAESIASVVKVLGASPDGEDRAMVWEWRIAAAKTGAALDEIATMLASEPHERMRADMLAGVEAARAKLPRAAHAPAVASP